MTSLSGSSLMSIRSTLRKSLQNCHTQARGYASEDGGRSWPRHLLSIADLTAKEFYILSSNAQTWKYWYKGPTSLPTRPGFRYDVEQRSTFNHWLRGLVVAMMFNKRSTRTRVSTESAISFFGGTPMFLGKEDIQLGVNESVKDTAKVISSMVRALVVRTGAHSSIEELARESSVPVINALTDDHHPLQAIADILTIRQAMRSLKSQRENKRLHGLKLAWVGDANNVLFDLAIAAVKMGFHISVATPKGYEIPAAMVSKINAEDETIFSKGSLFQTNVPEEAVDDADIILTDTWVSMGQEEEKAKRLKDFEGFQVTEELAKRGGAKDDWRFMHCLPRHAEEVSDEVFYSGRRSLVFQEAENRLYAMLAVLDAFLRCNGVIKKRGFPSQPTGLTPPNTTEMPMD